ncbi:response regulator [Algoriphagus aquimarinus]|uniref:response regulator n=1 Tax=Algoriphagus aquimarinus TaxID=237018 RepID=UPI0030DCAC69|tara:strand:+ start:3677 stop:4063 length:387 start_codon:yes stop_codon:yes gene_type:complete
MKLKNIMIIDDDADDRFFFKDALAKMPHAVECMEANGGQEAFELLRKASQLPNYIFLDINMPRIDGRECLKQLKSDEKLKHIPVIMYSTSFSEESIIEFHKLGASSCLYKPTDLKKLPAQILEAIGEQ